MIAAVHKEPTRIPVCELLLGALVLIATAQAHAPQPKWGCLHMTHGRCKGLALWRYTVSWLLISLLRVLRCSRHAP